MVSLDVKSLSDHDLVGVEQVIEQQFTALHENVRALCHSMLSLQHRVKMSEPGVTQC
jgi:hypothetical protein